VRRILRYIAAIALLVIPLLGAFIGARVSKSGWYNVWKVCA
jgi:hypothetical protein